MASSPSVRIKLPTYAMEIAKTVRMRSEDPYYKVGAVALSDRGRIVAAGYNGLAPGKEVSPAFWDARKERLPFMIHAEQNLAAQLKLGEATLAVCTLQPCEPCLKQLVALGIKEVYYLEAHRNGRNSEVIADFYGVTFKQLKL